MTSLGFMFYAYFARVRGCFLKGEIDQLEDMLLKGQLNKKFLARDYLTAKKLGQIQII